MPFILTTKSQKKPPEQCAVVFGVDFLSDWYLGFHRVNFRIISQLVFTVENVEELNHKGHGVGIKLIQFNTVKGPLTVLIIFFVDFNIENGKYYIFR
jgi:hypothetical protein